MSDKDAIINFLRQFRIAFENRLENQFATSGELTALQNSIPTGDNASENNQSNIDTSNFVLQEDGKGLSTNDFTDADKELLNSLSENSESLNFSSSDLDYIFQ